MDKDFEVTGVSDLSRDTVIAKSMPEIVGHHRRKSNLGENGWNSDQAILNSSQIIENPVFTKVKEKAVDLKKSDNRDRTNIERRSKNLFTLSKTINYISRVIFPLAFLIFNITYYYYFSTYHSRNSTD